LTSGNLTVRVLADEHFGLVHGKAGVITRRDGTRTCFLGSVNESKFGWRLNYELLWEDESDEAVAWVREEFDALCNHAYAYPLADAVVADVGRLSRRRVSSVAQWRESTEPAAAAVEAPVSRQSLGLWAHQKYFVKLAFDAHRTPQGARFVQADEVGLGKTLQLGMAAQLMARWTASGRF
jgi:phosphatidylserine/phosphatidylglycerophosphate/cardiolipin synthase-like enzyme